MNKRAVIILIVVLLIGIVGALTAILAIQERGDARDQQQVDELNEMNRKATEAREKLMRPSTGVSAPPRSDGQPHGYEVAPIPTSRPDTGGDR